MALIDYYKKVLDSLGLIYDDEGYIFIPSNKKPTLILEDNLPLCLPTKENIASLFEDTDDGVQVTKMLYNPIDENVVKGDNVTLVRTKTVIEGRLGHAIMASGALLLMLAHNPELQRKINSLEVNKFLASLADVKKQNMKEIVDDKTIAAWTDMYESFLKKRSGVVEIYLKKSGRYENVQYNRLATMKHAIWDEISNATADTPVGGVRLRPKDINVFKLLFPFLLEGLDENGVISLGSNDKYSAGYIALMNMYIKLMTRLNTLNRTLADVDPEIADSGYVGIELTEADINGVEQYSVEVGNIPTSMEIERKLRTAEIKPQVIQAPQQPAQVPQQTLPVAQPAKYMPQSQPENGGLEAYLKTANTYQPPMLAYQPPMAPMPNVGMQPMGLQPAPGVGYQPPMGGMSPYMVTPAQPFRVGTPTPGPMSSYNPNPYGVGYPTLMR